MYPLENNFPMTKNPQRSWVCETDQKNFNAMHNDNAFCDLTSFFCTQNGV